jgi:type I restriction enzyme S subunit
MADRYSKIGLVYNNFDTFQLKSVLTRNDAGDWGTEPDNNAVGIIRSTNFNNDGKLDLKDVAYRTLLPQKFAEKKLYANDILIERSGGSDTQPVGRVGFITEAIAKDDYAFANFIQRISLDDSVDALYVYYCLQQMYEMGITASMQFQTTGIRNLDWKYYLKIRLPKPSKAEQIAIANILLKVDEAITSVENSIAAAERLKKSLMQNLLTGKMKPDGTFRTPDEFYIDEKFGKVPVGWKEKKLKDIANIQRGKFGHRPRNDERFYNGDYPFVQTSDVVESVLYLRSASQSLNELGASVSKCFPQNTIIMTIAANIGYVALASYEVYFPDSLIGINSNEDFIKSTYLLFLLMRYKNVLDAQATESAQKNINYSNLRSLPILFPANIEEQIQITERITKIFNEIESKKSRIIVLERIKKSLMQNLLTGKVRII